MQIVSLFFRLTPIKENIVRKKKSNENVWVYIVDKTAQKGIMDQGEIIMKTIFCRHKFWFEF